MILFDNSVGAGEGMKTLLCYQLDINWLMGPMACGGAAVVCNMYAVS